MTKLTNPQINLSEETRADAPAITIKQVGLTPQQLKAAASVMAHFHARPRMASAAMPGHESRPGAA